MLSATGAFAKIQFSTLRNKIADRRNGRTSLYHHADASV